MSINEDKKNILLYRYKSDIKFHNMVNILSLLRHDLAEDEFRDIIDCVELKHDYQMCLEAEEKGG